MHGCAGNRESMFCIYLGKESTSRVNFGLFIPINNSGRERVDKKIFMKLCLS